jgi:peptidoglycan hydrolase-like protein with peptidoglycan-binding domain
MNIAVDGIFGPRTERALAVYQQRLVQRGLLEPDAVRPGVFDEQTRMATLADAWQRGMSEIRSTESANSGATLHRALQVAMRYNPSSQSPETAESLVPLASISTPPVPPRRR